MSNNMKLNHLYEETYQAVNGVFGDKLEDVLLYGSYARGDYDEESDIDVMVLVKLTKKELSEYRRKISDISSDLDLRYGVLLSIKLQDVETFQRYADSLPFFQNVVKEGIRLA